MTLYDITMYTIIFLSFLIGFLHVFASLLFKKNSDKYKKILRDFNSAGLQLDTTSKFASNLGFYANYQKISYIHRLQKGVKMKFRQNEDVREDAYVFIQSQPEELTRWIASLVFFIELYLYSLRFLVLFCFPLFIYLISSFNE
ncbi:hypothetical protein C1N63_05325 [Pantoea ananatis]|uniref:hypothetical protein n=1 Tax=Pantoea ananas TaxID=553 RepID=UPI0007DAC172|nr:hypothetical protein [Pantoea ananatis]AWQ18298.1 hypothetical protein C1N63_05325 [Pantoea ananatis]MBN6030183.1 hypothetical protein [Pantoea ananatis]UYL00992.1 hypothetical protein NG830_17510 [Pantoea ananatis]